MLFTVDDLCLSHLDNFKYFDEIKSCYPKLDIIAFAIANYKNEELLVESSLFKAWFEKHKDWVQIGVHSYDHEYPPDADRDDEENWIKKAKDGLEPFLPEWPTYRSPGWQTTSKTIPILKKLGFRYIAYESKVADIIENRIVETQVINSHLYDVKSIERLKGVPVRHRVLRPVFRRRPLEAPAFHHPQALVPRLLHLHRFLLAPAFRLLLQRVLV